MFFAASSSAKRDFFYFILTGITSFLVNVFILLDHNQAS